MVAPRPFFSAATATKLLGIDQRGQATEMRLWVDAYTILRTARPGGWDDGTTPEDVTTITEAPGLGQLVGGPGPGDSVDAVIVSLTPLRFRLPVGTVLDSATDALVINGDTYLVDDVDRGGANSLIAEATIRRREGN